VVGLERLHVLDLEQEVGVRGGLGRHVQHDRRRDQLPGRHLRHVGRLAPVIQWIGASKWVPVCSPVEMLFQYQAGPRSS
jgi:hypothetical protein